MLNDEFKKISIQYENIPIENTNKEHFEEPTKEAAFIPLTNKKKRFSTLISHPFFPPSIYIMASLFVFFILISILHTYVFRLKVETAVVNAQIETMVAPVSGYIKDSFVTPGVIVKKGTPLLKIENLDLERRLQLAHLEVDESQLMVNYYQQLVENEEQRLNIYKKIGHNRVVSAKTSVNRLKQEVITAKNNLDRFASLYQKNYMSKALWEKKQMDYNNALEKLQDAKAQKNVEVHALNAVGQGLYFTGNKTEGVGSDLYAKWHAEQKKSILNQHKVQIFEDLIKKLTLVAPFDGKITQILKSAGNTTDNVTPLIFIEKEHANKTITAYLTQNEIIYIDKFKSVKIYMPSTGKIYHGEIIEINRTEGFVDEIKAQYRWRDFQIDKSAVVIIRIQKNEQREFNQHAFAGMPAIVYFSKKWIF